MHSTFTQTPAHWELKRTEVALKNSAYTIYKKTYEHPVRKVEADITIAKVSDGVIVVPLTKDNNIVLVQQYRFGCEALLWEFPGGGMDAQELPIECGLRELAEETGYTGDSPVLLASCFSNPAYLTNQLHYVYVSNCRWVQNPSWDEHEELLVKEFSLTEIQSMVASGQICNSMTLTGLLLAHSKGLITL